jgi:hypothetical protein
MNIFSYGDNSWIVTLRRNLVQWKIVDMPTIFFWMIVSFIRTFWVWRWWDFQTTEVNAKLAPGHVGPYNFACGQVFRGWTTFNKITFARIQKCERAVRLKVKIHGLFWGENSWTIALRHTKLCTTLKIVDMPTGFIWVIISFDRHFEYSGISYFWGYVETDAGLLCL